VWRSGGGDLARPFCRVFGADYFVGGMDRSRHITGRCANAGGTAWRVVLPDDGQKTRHSSILRRLPHCSCRTGLFRRLTQRLLPGQRNGEPVLAPASCHSWRTAALFEWWKNGGS
jgi:hypothetical protein